MPHQFRTAAYQIQGLESYFKPAGSTARFTAAQEERNAVTTNFMEFSSRAGFIHRNNESRAEAIDLARQIFPGRRSALFEGVRLAAADRNPIVGFFPPPEITSYDALKVKFQKENYAALASREILKVAFIFRKKLMQSLLKWYKR
jgi:hypothetical protein